MTIRGKVRSAVLAGVLVVLVFALGRHSRDLKTTPSALVSAAKTYLNITTAPPKMHVEDWTGVDVTVIPDHYHYNDPSAHRIVKSPSSTTGEYFFIKFGDNAGYNPNIIPHKLLNDTWIVTAQRQDHTAPNSVWWAEWVCTARFDSAGDLSCIKAPLILPIAATEGRAHLCPPEMAFTGLSSGPHDARVFWGPEKPYVIYGSNSDEPCLGMWVQDFRMLVDWGYELAWVAEFRLGTELKRPLPWTHMEKNWFMFWDVDGAAYVHHDTYPRRVFARLAHDGTVGPDLGPQAPSDESCLRQLMPAKAAILEGIHQATNSLSVTLCARTDPTCVVTDANTKLFHIFQHKSYYAFHGNYEPYVMTFERRAPFAVHGIARKPFWINGRTRAGSKPSWIDGDGGRLWREEGRVYDERQSEMFYVTSVSWKDQGMRYHGYIDDILFISFGIEDSLTAAIDVVAGDLFLDLDLCSDL